MGRREAGTLALKKNIYSFVFGYAGSSSLCMGFFLVSVNRGYSLVVARGLLIVVASLVAEHTGVLRLQ